jgi:hypothetical protein
LSQTQNPALKTYWKGKLAADKAEPEKTPGRN